MLAGSDLKVWTLPRQLPNYTTSYPLPMLTLTNYKFHPTSLTPTSKFTLLTSLQLNSFSTSISYMHTSLSFTNKISSTSALSIACILKLLTICPSIPLHLHTNTVPIRISISLANSLTYSRSLCYVVIAAHSIACFLSCCHQWSYS